MYAKPLKYLIKHLLNRAGLQIRRIDATTVLDERRYLWLTGRPIKTVFDIGANTGEWAIFYQKLLPHARIYCFEPQAECYAQLTSNVAAYPSIKAFNLALGDTTGETVLYRSAYSGSSSLLPMAELHWQAYPHTTPVGQEPVRVARLDELASDLLLQDDILIKMDVQGYEHKVLAGAAALVRRARVIITEVSFEELYAEQSLFHEIYCELRNADFCYMGNLKQMLSPLTGSVLQADAIFLRR